MITSEVRNKYGISVALKKNGNLHCTPKSRMTEESRSFIREHKKAIIQELQYRPAAALRKPKFHLSSLPEHLMEIPRMGDIAKRLIDDHIPSILIDWYQKQMETHSHGGCKCKAMQAKMNDVGPEGIKRDREEYVEHFRSQIKYMPFAGNISERFIDKVMAEVEPERDKLPDDTIVITAADHNFLKGAYLLAWTTLHMNDCRLRVYDLGIDRSNRMYKDMVNWGVEFVRFNYACAHKEYTGWQTLNKPRMILHAMKEKEVVLWIDADAAVAGYLGAMVSMARLNPVIPDHGYHDAFNDNPSGIYDIMPEPLQRWGSLSGKSKKHFPCAGVMGMSKIRDEHWVREWSARIDMAADRGLLGLYKYFDQGVLQDVYSGPLVDGRIWNNLESHRMNNVHQQFGQFATEDSVIFHFGGDIKPWMDWEPMRWPNPRFVKERHDRPAPIKAIELMDPSELLEDNHG